MSDTTKGMLLVISGPSGTGKGTLAAKLLEADPTFAFSVSVTTRAPRPGEIQDVHYHFISNEKYDEYVAQDAFLERADVHGNRYGTLKAEVYERLDKGLNVLLDIDVQGALNVMQKEPECVSVFILPPSMDELRSRLVNRHTESEADVERRLNNAMGEIELAPKYTYNIINDDLDSAFHMLMSVIEAEKHHTNRYTPVVL